MKCDELQKFDATSNAERSAGIESRYAYDADEVDEAIEEFKEVYKESVDVKVKIWERCKNLEEQNAQLKRFLWQARALALSRFDVDEYLRKYTHCNSIFWNNGFNTFNEACKQMQKAINIAEAKCRAKSKELK